MLLKHKLGNYKISSHKLIDTLSINENLKYINNVVEDYFKVSLLPYNSILDKRILEVGPGDNFGVALKFLALGASQVVCLDKFIIKRNMKR